MTFVCLDHGAPSYWMPLRLILRRRYCASPRLVSCVVFTIFFIQQIGSHSMVTSEAGVSPAARPHWIPMGNLKRCNHTSSFPPPPNNSQCLQVNYELTRTICNNSITTRVQKMRQSRLRHCSSYPVFHLLENKCQNLQQLSEAECVECLDNLEELDAQVYAIYRDFEDIMSRYDCGTNFSTHWTCTDCKNAYKGWLCSMAIRYLIDDQEVPPCRIYCEEVERRCPYLLPQKDNQYAGEPSFLCTDSVMEYQALIKRHVEGRCYRPCNPIHGDDGVCLNDTTDSTAATSTHTNSENQNASVTREERSRSRGARLLASAQTRWVSFAAQLGSILWCSRTLSQHWVIGLT